MAEKVTGAIERLLLPKLSSIEGELKAINSEIKRLETKIDSLDERLNTRINSLSEKIDVIRDIEMLKAKVASLERR